MFIYLAKLYVFFALHLVSSPENLAAFQVKLLFRAKCLLSSLYELPNNWVYIKIFINLQRFSKISGIYEDLPKYTNLSGIYLDLSGFMGFTWITEDLRNWHPLSGCGFKWILLDFWPRSWEVISQSRITQLNGTYKPWFLSTTWELLVLASCNPTWKWLRSLQVVFSTWQVVRILCTWPMDLSSWQVVLCT